LIFAIAIGPCKTEISEQPVPLDEIVLEELKVWHPVCGYPEVGDWIFASDFSFGKTPSWPDSLRAKILQPTARRAGDHQADWVAHVPAHVQLIAGNNWE
jgi:integrase